MRKRTWQSCKRSLRTGNKASTWRRAAGRHGRGLPPPTTGWLGRVQRSWSRSKLRPNELKRRTSTAAQRRYRSAVICRNAAVYKRVLLGRKRRVAGPSLVQLIIKRKQARFAEPCRKEA